MTKLRFLSLFAVVLMAAALASSCGSDKTSVGANEVAVVGDCSISKEQYDRLLDQAHLLTQVLIRVGGAGHLGDSDVDDARLVV